MTSQKFRRVVALAFLLASRATVAQVESTEDAIFWEVSGNGLAKSSYLFGSNHLLGRQYVDSFVNVNQKFWESEAFVTEVILDSTHFSKMIGAAMMQDTTLDQLLPPEWFSETERWLAELSDYEDLSAFKPFNPLTIQVMILNLLQVRIYGESDDSMDMHLQNKANLAGKIMVDLETMDEQLNALFHSTSYKRQAELLIEFVRQRESAEEELIRFNELYFDQNISTLHRMTREKYTPAELAVMLDDRNNRWIRSLVDIMNQQSAFVVVGALHLAGEKGLVRLLRDLGYSVTPVPLQ